MNWKPFAWIVGGVSAGMLLYGAFVEAERLVIRRHRLRLKRWPKAKDGYKISLIADFHIRDQYTVELTRRAIKAAIEEEPDAIVIAGDFVGYWKPESPWLLAEALQQLKEFDGHVIAVPGNHDYWAGDAACLEPICEELGITLLRNEADLIDGIRWLGIDSYNSRRANLGCAIERLAPLPDSYPAITIWHEPDVVNHLPPVTDLMLSGHSHGGQFVFPGGFIPMTTKNGKRYLGGFYANATTPLFVTRGIGTTGPPSRFLCPPEIVLLTLFGN